MKTSTDEPAWYRWSYSRRFCDAARSDAEREDPNPVYAAFMGSRVSRSFARDEVRAEVERIDEDMSKNGYKTLGIAFGVDDGSGNYQMKFGGSGASAVAPCCISGRGRG
mgnify:CR=1 FL=1